MYFSLVKTYLLIFVCSLIALQSCVSNNETKQPILTPPTTSTPYYDYAQKTADFYLDSLETYMAKWRETIGYDDTGNLKTGASEIYLAALFANLYELTDETAYLNAAKIILLKYGEYRALAGKPTELRPEYKKGIPPIPNFFLPPKYARAAQVVLANNAVNENEKQIILNILSETADYTLATQEWGPMNRAMLRAEGLLLTCLVIENHENRANWEQMGKTILNDNLKNWSIEDAGMYNMIWMYSLCGYTGYHPAGSNALNTPFMHYYFEYFKNLQSPAGVIPDYGDAWWRSWWAAAVPVFESGAKTFGNGEYKWIAENTFSKNVNPDKYSIDLALKLSEAIIWGNNEIKSNEPIDESSEVLDDVIGKKVVFRNGWDDQSTYLLYNYKDEGNNGLLFKANLRNTLSVAHEKMHHGHSDEQSIAFFMHKGSVLLHDGGYRTELPSGPNGEYRADIFHNKIIIRPGINEFNNGLVNSLKSKGLFENKRTEKVDFQNDTYCDYSRTRMFDEANNVVHDRIINYLKNEGIFVVFDIIESTKYNNEVSLANLWHSQEIISSGENWFLTKYSKIGNWENGDASNLRIEFPLLSAGNVLTDSLERHKQAEQSMAQCWTGTMKKGEKHCFITFLKAVDGKQTYEYENNSLLPEMGNNSMGISFKTETDTFYICHKLDLAADSVRNWPRPKYTYESGEISIKEYSSDANFMFISKNKNNDYFNAVNCTKVLRNGKTLFEQPKVSNEFRTDGAESTADAWKVRSIQRIVGK